MSKINLEVEEVVPEVVAVTPDPTPDAAPSALSPSRNAFNNITYWEVHPDEAGMRAVNTVTQEVFIGEVADFNKILRGI
jgi:hypothetical protein